MRVTLLFLTLLVAACSHDHDDGHTHGDRPADCVAIGERCHEFDIGSGTGHDCHANSHATWDAATCAAKKADCFAACSASDSGTDSGADTGAAPGDASPADAADGG